MILIPIPVVELSAHFAGYMVRIVEYKPRRRGSFAKCVGELSLLGMPLCLWAGVAAEPIWLCPAMMYFGLICACGYVLEAFEEQESVLDAGAANEDDWREPNVLYIEEARAMELR